MPGQGRRKDGMVLGDAVAHGILLWAICGGCGRRAVLNPAEIAQRCGYDVPVCEVRQRMKCSRCGSRAVELTTNYETTAPAQGDPDR